MEAVLEQSTLDPFLVSVVVLVISIPLHDGARPGSPKIRSIQ